MNMRSSVVGSLLALVLATNAEATVIITPASGGGAISADTAANGHAPAWTTLGPITIAEGKKQDFGHKVKNDTLVLKVPAGFEFNTASTPSISFASGADVTSASVAISDSTTLTITYSANSQKNLDTLIIGATGLQVRPTQAGPVAAGNHIYSPSSGGGTASIDGITTSTNGSDGSDFGTLTEVAAAYAQVQLLLPGETAAPGTTTGKTGSPSAETAGTPFNVIVNAADAYWNVATPTTNVVGLSTTDAKGVVPPSTALVAGTKTLPVTLKTAGSWTITATDQTDLTKAPVTSPPVVVNPGPASMLVMAVQPSPTDVAGQVLAQQPAVLIEDAYSNVRSNDSLTVTAAASSGPGTLLGTTSIAAVNGLATYANLAPTAALNVTLRFTSDSLTPAISSNILVSAGPFSRLLVMLPGETNAQGTATGHGGTPFATVGSNTLVRVLATDTYFNPADGSVADTVAVTTSDTAAILPPNAALINGSNTFNLLFKKAGSQTVTASDVTDPSKLPNTDPVVVSAGPFVKLQLLVPGETAAPATATGKTGTPTAAVSGTSFPVIVNGVDAYWNVAPTANGTSFTIQITSSDTNAILPANADLASGTRTFNIALRTAGSWTLTASDVDDTTKTPSTSPPITVNPAPFGKLQILLPGETAAPGSTTGKTGTPLAQTAGTPFSVTVKSVDLNWNQVVTNDVVHVTSSDANAVLPADTALNNGAANVAITLKTAGTRTITASDVTHPGILPNTSSSLTVNPGAFAKLQVLVPGERAVPGTSSGKTGSPLAQTSSVPFAVTVNGVDTNWNVVNATDTIRITSSDPGAVLPPNAPLAAGTRNFSITLVSAGTGLTVTASDLTQSTIAAGTSSPLTVLLSGAPSSARGNPMVAIHDSEFTRALETMPAAPTTPTGPGTTGNEWWPTNWHYFVMPESVKEALRSDGTAFAVVSDADIISGKLLDATGRPRYPILISLASEAMADSEIAPLTNYVAAGGFLFVGSSSFTRNTNGTTRGDFAFANQMGVHSLTPGLTNWRSNSLFTKQADHRLVSHIPSGQALYWEMPSSGDEIPWGIYPHPGNPFTANSIWQVQSSNTTLIISGDVSPCLLDRAYGGGHFIYDASMQPLIGHGGWAPGMYAYLIVRKAIEWAFESARMPIPKLSPWPYPYNAALMVRHDLENFANEIAAIESSAQVEFTNGVKGEYYFCTGTLREEMSPAYDTNAVVASYRRAISNYNALINSHNGGLRNPYNNPPLVLTNYDYWHWGPDEAINATVTNFSNGKAYALTSVSNSFRDIEGWLPGLSTPNRRVWVAPYFDATREDSYDIENQLGVKATGEQKLTTFPSWVVSTVTPGKRYPFISLPVSDWYVGNMVSQSLEAGHNSASVHALVDFYYGLGGLINLYSHTLSSGLGPSGSLETDYVTYSANTTLHPRLWPVNALNLYDWWVARTNAQVAVSYYTTNGENAVTTFNITGATDPNTALEIVIPTNAALSTLQVLANGSPAGAGSYRTNGQALKILVGTTVTNVQVLYFFGPQAQNDTYTFADGPVLKVPAPGVLANDTAGAGGTSFTAVLVTGPTNGTLALNANGGFVYTPAPGFGGFDAFTYRVSDGVASSAPALVILTNANPPTFSDNFQRSTDPGPVAPWIVHAGNWTVTGGQLQGGPNTLSTYGNVYLNNDWIDYAATAQIKFPVGAYGGGLGGRLNPATGQHYGAWIYPENSPGGSDVLKLIKFQDWNNWTLLQQVSLAAVGTNWHNVRLAFKGNQIAVAFDGTQLISVADSFAYPSGGISVDMWTDAAAYVIAVDNVTVSPLVTADSYSTPENTTLNVPAPGVLGNDIGLFGATLSAAALTTPAHGALTLNANGGFTYAPALNYAGPDTFIYQASDGANVLGSAWVNLSVIPTPVMQPSVASVTTASPPLIHSVAFSRGGAQLTWGSVSGRIYRLEYKASLRDTDWTALSPNVTATGTTASAMDKTTNASQRFYRVVLLP
jgi:hypothetical protein